MLQLFILLYSDQVFFDYNINLKSGNCDADTGCLFHTQKNAESAFTFLHIFDLQETDVVKYSLSDNWVVDINDPSWLQSTEQQRKTIFYSSGQVFVRVISQTARTIYARGGASNPTMCPDGTFILSTIAFDLQSFVSSYSITFPSTFCLIYPYKTMKVTIQNTLNKDTDSLKYMVDNSYFEYLTDTVTVEAYDNGTRNNPTVYLILNIASSSPARTLQFAAQSHSEDFEGAKFVFDSNNMAVDNNPTEPDVQPIQPSTPTPSPSSSSSSSRSSSSSSSSTSSSSTTTSSTSSPSSTSSTNSPATSQPTISTDNPSTPVETPSATWDGEWADPPNVIIRGDDIPEIAETHPPIQTKYVKTEVPKVTKVVNISTGTILAIVVVILSVINIVRSSRKLYRIASNNDFEGENDDLSWSFTYSTDISTESNDPFIVS